MLKAVQKLGKDWVLLGPALRKTRSGVYGNQHLLFFAAVEGFLLHDVNLAIARPVTTCA